MKGVVYLLVVFAAVLYLGDALPQHFRSISGAENHGGKILLHTTGVEKGHVHTASCFGFGQPPGPPGPPPTAATTTASSK